MESLILTLPQQPQTQRGQRAWGARRGTPVSRTRPDARQLGGLFMALLLVSEACSGSGLGTLESIPNGRDWGAGQEGLRKIAHESIINTMTS